MVPLAKEPAQKTRAKKKGMGAKLKANAQLQTEKKKQEQAKPPPLPPPADEPGEEEEKKKNDELVGRKVRLMTDKYGEGLFGSEAVVMHETEKNSERTVLWKEFIKCKVPNGQ